VVFFSPVTVHYLTLDGNIIKTISCLIPIGLDNSLFNLTNSYLSQLVF
jgi:hypothetical protein